MKIWNDKILLKDINDLILIIQFINFVTDEGNMSF